MGRDGMDGIGWDEIGWDEDVLSLIFKDISNL